MTQTTTTRNPNLERFAYAAVAKLQDAVTTPGTSHMHAGVRVGTGAVQTGPVVNWRFDKDDHSTYGYIEIINYAGARLIKPMTDLFPSDIRPCWDTCKYAPAVRPDGQGTADHDQARQQAVDVLFGELNDELHDDQFEAATQGLEAALTQAYESLLPLAIGLAGDEPSSRTQARETLASLLIGMATEKLQGLATAADLDEQGDEG